MAAGVPDPGGGVAGSGPDAVRRRSRLLAGLLLAATGLIGILVGAATIPIDPYVDIAEDGTYHLDVTGWGWLRLVIGVTTAASALALAVDRHSTTVLAVATGAATIGVAILMLPYHPLPASISVTLAAMAIWLLAGQLRNGDRKPSARR